MSPKVLLIIIAVLALARIVLWVAPHALPATRQRAILREYLDAFIIAGVVALVLMQYIVRTFYIPSGSMEPTLDINDVLLANEIQYRVGKPKDGQIAVFEPPPVLGTTDFIKRVMATPGDSIKIHNGAVYRNGERVFEPYVAHPADYELEVKNYAIYVNGVPQTEGADYDVRDDALVFRRELVRAERLGLRHWVLGAIGMLTRDEKGEIKTKN